MKQAIDQPGASDSVDSQRRQLLQAAGAGVVAATFSGLTFGASKQAGVKPATALRWGVVGTGAIANQMAPMILQAGNAQLAGVSTQLGQWHAPRVQTASRPHLTCNRGYTDAGKALLFFAFATPD